MKYEFGYIVRRADKGSLVVVGKTIEGKYLAAPYRKGGNLENETIGEILRGRASRLMMVVPSREDKGRVLNAFINDLQELTDEEIEMHEADHHAVSVYHKVATKRNAPDTNSSRLRFLPKNLV